MEGFWCLCPPLVLFECCRLLHCLTLLWASGHSTAVWSRRWAVPGCRWCGWWPARAKPGQRRSRLPWGNCTSLGNYNLDCCLGHKVFRKINKMHEKKRANGWLGLCCTGYKISKTDSAEGDEAVVDGLGVGPALLLLEHNHGHDKEKDRSTDVANGVDKKTRTRLQLDTGKKLMLVTSPPKQDLLLWRICLPFVWFSLQWIPRGSSPVQACTSPLCWAPPHWGVFQRERRTRRRSDRL